MTNPAARLMGVGGPDLITGPSHYAVLMWGTPFVLAAAYFFLFWERRGDDSPNKDDTQVGLKLLVYMMMIFGLALAAGGLTRVLYYLLGGAKPSIIIKGALGTLITGVAMFAAMYWWFFPRTNAGQYTKIERFAVGWVAGVAGVITILALESLLSGLFTGLAWKPSQNASSMPNAANLAELIVFGGLAFLSLTRFGAMSGWVAPVRQPRLPAGFQQQQGYGQPAMQQPAYGQPAHPGEGYPPQSNAPLGGGAPPAGSAPQQGFPPQGGSAPQQGGGGFPPQSGGAPQQGGGFPPQGGSAPQQGGGGLPPPGGYKR